MKLLQFVGVILAVSIAGESIASCGDPQVTGTDLTDLFRGNTVCVSNGSGGWEHQEQHHDAGGATPGGDLVDYKRGSGDAIDPTEVVGSWSIGRGAIRYTYSGTTLSYTQARGASVQSCRLSLEQDSHPSCVSRLAGWAGLDVSGTRRLRR